MYTLDLKEVKLNPPITEEKKFENEDQFALQDEVVAYIDANYPNVYANAFTVKRHVEAAIRDQSGATFDERVDAQIEQDRKTSDERIAQMVAAEETINAEYQPRLDEVNTWVDSEIQKLTDEYFPKINAASDEERQTLEEEKALKFDEIQLESQKKRDAIYEERNAKVTEASAST